MNSFSSFIISFLDTPPTFAKLDRVWVISWVYLWASVKAARQSLKITTVLPMSSLSAEAFSKRNVFFDVNKNYDELGRWSCYVFDKMIKIGVNANRHWLIGSKNWWRNVNGFTQRVVHSCFLSQNNHNQSENRLCLISLHLVEFFYCIFLSL